MKKYRPKNPSQIYKKKQGMLHSEALSTTSAQHPLLVYKRLIIN
jgi:hypothetical protein